MAKAVKTAEEYEEDHRKKREEEDKMKEKQRKRADRLERINPGTVPFPMSIEETEEIEQLLIDVPDEEITVEKIKEVVERSEHGQQKKEWILNKLKERRENPLP